MATHSSSLAWRIPWMEEPGGLQSMGWLGVGRDWATSLSLFIFMHQRRRWQPTPVFLPGESQGWESLVGCGLWGRTESDMTEATWQQQQQQQQQRRIQLVRNRQNFSWLHPHDLILSLNVLNYTRIIWLHSYRKRLRLRRKRKSMRGIHGKWVNI